MILRNYSYDNSLKGVFVNGYHHQAIEKLDFKVNLVYDNRNLKKDEKIKKEMGMLVRLARELNINLEIVFKSRKDLESISEMISLGSSDIVFERDMYLSLIKEDFKNSDYYLENKETCEVPYAEFVPPLTLKRIKL